MATIQHDFTRGSILRHLITFSGPIMAANLLQTSYQLVDSFWIGNLLGAQALGAVAISSVIATTVLSFVIGMNNAALAILSQQRGRRDDAGLRAYLNAFVVILFLIAIALGGAGFATSHFLLEMLGTPADIMAPAQDYLQVTFLGMLFLFGYNFIATVLRSLGDSKTPLRFVFVAVLLNVFLDPLFISGFELEIRGAAYATVLSQGIAFTYGLVHVLSKKLAPLQLPQIPTLPQTRKILRLGIPSGLQMAVISGGSAAVMSVVANFGADVVGGFGAAQRLDALIMLPAQALGIAVSSMAGQNIGRGNWQRVSQVSRVAVLYNLAIMLLFALGMIAVARPAVQIFISEPPAVEFGVKYMRMIALCYPFLGINFVLNGIVRASGAMYQVLALNIISFWVLRYPLTALATSQLDETGIAVGMGLSFILSSAVAYSYFRFGKWRELKLFETPVKKQ